jgi:polyhydroxyalkanoate synthesis regulator phasin
MYESDAVKIEIKGMSVHQVMEQMAQAGTQMNEAMQGEYVPKAMMDRLNSKFDELYVQVSRLLDLVPDIGLDQYPAEKDINEIDPPFSRREPGRRKERGGVATTPCDVSDPPFHRARKASGGSIGFEGLKQAVREGYEVHKTSGADRDELMEALKAVIDEFTEHEDRMEAQGRAIDDLSRRVADQDRKMEERIQRKISSVIASFDEARRMEQEQRAPRHEHVQCSHVPIIFEYVSYEYDDDGNQKVASRSDQFIAGWTCGQDDKPTYGYTYDGKTVEKSVNVCLCGKCKQLFVVVDGVAVM